MDATVEKRVGTEEKATYNQLKKAAAGACKSCDDISADSVNRNEDEVTQKQIRKNKENRMRLCAKLGAQLCSLKNQYIKERCGKCFLSQDTYSVINCQKCIKLNKIQLFYDRMKELTIYEKYCVRFLISFSRLCVCYIKIIIPMFDV